MLERDIPTDMMLNNIDMITEVLSIFHSHIMYCIIVGTGDLLLRLDTDDRTDEAKNMLQCAVTVQETIPTMSCGCSIT